MAKLSAHGKEIGRVNYSTFSKAYMEDGKVLKNAGFGWKIAGTLKDGISPVQGFENAKRNWEEKLAARPEFAIYVRELHSLTGLCNRWKLVQAIQLLGDDVDGIWSECCDGYGDNISADVDEVANLVRLYGAAMLELKALKESEPA
tara:strand:+ start:1426 stop:1863 length:438 start_codon:yes stop_codon:yes gene_type:complete